MKTALHFTLTLACIFGSMVAGRAALNCFFADVPSWGSLGLGSLATVACVLSQIGACSQAQRTAANAVR